MYTMNLFTFLASLFYVVQVPTGNYVGGKTLFGETINAIVNINDASSLDFAISGDFTLDCKDESYSLVDNTIILDDIELVGDCAHDALVDNQITLKGIVYDAEQNHITVTAKYSIATVDIVLMPVQLYKNEEKSTFEKSTFEKSGVKTYREGGLRGRCSSV